MSGSSFDMPKGKMNVFDEQIPGQPISREGREVVMSQENQWIKQKDSEVK